MSDAIKLAIDALQEVSAKLRLTGATLPAPEPKGTIESAMTTGICVALAVVEDSLAALRAQPDHSELVKRLRVRSLMIIAWGSDSALMDEAADALEGKAIGETK